MLENEKMNISKSFDESFFSVSRAFFRVFTDLHGQIASDMIILFALEMKNVKMIGFMSQTNNFQTPI